MESPIERRIRETFERCKTPVQRRKCERLHALDKTAYPEKWQGKTVIAEFNRYCRDYDPAKIGHALYNWSIMGSGGLNDIAHYNLYGFRGTYPHPALYIEKLLMPEVKRHWPSSFYVIGTWPTEEEQNWFHSQGVYTDGMTKGEVAAQILLIAETARANIAMDYTRKAEAFALAEAERLAGSIGMKVVPA